MLNKFGELNRKRKEFRANTVDHMAGAHFDALLHCGKALVHSFKAVGTVAVALLFTLLNKWQ